MSPSQKLIDLNSMRVRCPTARHTPVSTALSPMCRQAISTAYPTSYLPQNSHHPRSNLTTPNTMRSMSSYVDEFLKLLSHLVVSSSRFYSFILNPLCWTYAQDDTSSSIHGSMFESVLKTCYEIIEFGWANDRSLVDTFIMGLASSIR